MKEKPIHKGQGIGRDDGTGVLILLNDDINTFEHVIKSLVEVCGHDVIQAEQCATIVHFKGSCEVKRDIAAVLKMMSSSLEVKGLRTRIEL